MAALASSGGPPQSPSTVETVNTTSSKTEETEPERTVVNAVRPHVGEEQNTMNGLADDKMCEDLDSDDEGALRIAESEPETNTTPSADDVKQEMEDVYKRQVYSIYFAKFEFSGLNKQSINIKFCFRLRKHYRIIMEISLQ